MLHIENRFFHSFFHFDEKKNLIKHNGMTFKIRKQVENVMYSFASDFINFFLVKKIEKRREEN